MACTQHYVPPPPPPPPDFLYSVVGQRLVGIGHSRSHDPGRIGGAISVALPATRISPWGPKRGCSIRIPPGLAGNSHLHTHPRTGVPAKSPPCRTRTLALACRLQRRNSR